jgi:diguanylate cyclase (GGDEF)-like protein
MATRIEQLEIQLALAKTALEKIDALNSLAWELHGLDPRGLAYALQAYDLAQAEHNQKGMAESLVNQCEYIFSDFARVITLASQALAIFEQLEDRRGQSRAMYALCAAYWFADDFIQSIESGQRGLKLAQETGDRELEGDLLNNLGLAYKRSGNYELAFSVYAEALAIFHSTSNGLQEGKVLTNLALAYAEQGDYERALEYARQYEQAGEDHPRASGYILFVLGQIYTGRKAFEQALDYLQQAVHFAGEHAEHEQLAESALQTIGQVYIERQEPDQAIVYLQQGLAIAQAIQSNLYVYRFHELLSQVYENLGDLTQAIFHYKQFHAVKEKVFNDKNTGRRQVLETQHKTEIARREAEIYHLRTVELEQEITERKRLQEELRQQATTDELTQIFNRRHFLFLASIELKRAVRLNHPLSLVLIDLDYFKRINDTYGHIIGDQALLEFAQTFKGNIRTIDVFARFGGDEFALILPETESNQTVEVIERVQRALAEQRPKLGDTTITLSISAGISSLACETDSVDGLISRADQALYRAKAMGRNSVVVL